MLNYRTAEQDHYMGIARMKFKAPKSRSLVIENEKITNRFKFKINEVAIPTLSENL